MPQLANVKLNEVSDAIVAFPAAVPSSASALWANMALYERAAVYILVNNATTVTGSAIGFSQATDTSGTSAKTLAFTNVDVVLDTSNTTTGDQPTATAVSSNTFTTLTTNSKSALYIVNFKAADLDVANGFKTFRVTLGNATAATISVLYVLYSPKFGQATPPSALT